MNEVHSMEIWRVGTYNLLVVETNAQSAKGVLFTLDALDLAGHLLTRTTSIDGDLRLETKVMKLRISRAPFLRCAKLVFLSLSSKFPQMNPLSEFHQVSLPNESHQAHQVTVSISIASHDVLRAALKSIKLILFTVLTYAVPSHCVT